MELKNVKMIDLLLKLKYRKVSDYIIITRNSNFIIVIQYDSIPDITEISIYEDLAHIRIPTTGKEYYNTGYDNLSYQSVDGNLIPIFTVVSDEDYIKNRLKVEI